MEKNKIILFNHSGCLSREAIIAFQAKTLSSGEIYLIEKHLEECALCRDAMEGFASLTASELRRVFSGINYTMQQRLIVPKHRTLSRKVKLRLAAAIFLALIGVFSVFKFNLIKENTPVAQELTPNDIKQKTPVLSSNNKERVISRQAPVKTEENKNVAKKEKIQLAESSESDVPVERVPAPELWMNKEEVAADVVQEKAEEPAKESEVMAYSSQTPVAKRSKSATSQEVRYEEKAMLAGYKDNSETTFYVVEEPALFEGGDINKFKTWVETKLNAVATDQKLTEGSLTVTFTVDKNGTVKDVFVVRGLDAKTDSAAVAIVKSSPQWKPAKNQRKAVNINMVLPLKVNSQTK